MHGEHADDSWGARGLIELRRFGGRAEHTNERARSPWAARRVRCLVPGGCDFAAKSGACTPERKEMG